MFLFSEFKLISLVWKCVRFILISLATERSDPEPVKFVDIGLPAIRYATNIMASEMPNSSRGTEPSNSGIANNTPSIILGILFTFY